MRPKDVHIPETRLLMVLKSPAVNEPDLVQQLDVQAVLQMLMPRRIVNV